MDYKSYGGALFLGVKKPVVKAHGSSDETLFEFTIKQAEKFVENKAVDRMIEEFEKKSGKLLIKGAAEEVFPGLLEYLNNSDKNYYKDYYKSL
jgi:hypothetical protein